MAGRILTLQRQVRELGRLRAGITETKTKNGREISYPTSSKTWILSSPYRDYLDVAAALWGGTVEEWEPLGGGPKVWRVITNTAVIDAILPPGDPINQSYEQWSRGGCQRRCDGETELRSGQPCLCLAQFGPEFHRENKKKPGTVCDIHTRLSVMLPDLPDIGLWRVESKGFWPGNHITGYVDFIKAQAGPSAMVPVHLLIEPKRKIEDGKTSQYIEIVVRLRGAGTLGQMIAGGMPVVALDAGTQRQAIEAGPVNGDRAALEAGPSTNGNGAVKKTPAQYLALTKLCKNVEQVRTLWKDAAADGALDDQVKAALTAKSEQLKNGKKAPAEPTAAEPAPEVVEGEPEPDGELMWTMVLAAAGERGWSGPELERRFKEHQGIAVEDADGFKLQGFFEALKNGQVA